MSSLFINNLNNPRNDSQYPARLRELHNYSLFTYCRAPKHITPHEKQNTDRCIASLQTLHQILPPSSLKWQLAGGLSVDVLAGKFSRKHDDIDIQVCSEDAGNLLQALELNGFSLFRKRAVLRLGKDIHTAFCSKVRKGTSLNTEHSYRIWLGADSRCLPYADVYFSVPACGGRIIRDKGGKCFFPDSWHDSVQVVFADMEIAVRSPRISAELMKLKPEAEKARHDLRVLADLGIL